MSKTQVMQEGDAAPNFELPAHDGTIVSLTSYKGKKNVVLCFYPKNHIFGCPSKKVFKMSENIVASYPDIVATDSVLFAISIDTIKDQKKFVEEYNIPYPHLSDTKKETCKAYAGLNIAGLAKRSTFVIDKNGIVRKIFRNMDTKSHGKEILEFLKTL